MQFALLKCPNYRQSYMAKRHCKFKKGTNVMNLGKCLYTRRFLLVGKLFDNFPLFLPGTWHFLQSWRLFSICSAFDYKTQFVASLVYDKLNYQRVPVQRRLCSLRIWIWIRLSFPKKDECVLVSPGVFNYTMASSNNKTGLVFLLSKIMKFKESNCWLETKLTHNI